MTEPGSLYRYRGIDGSRHIEMLIETRKLTSEKKQSFGLSGLYYEHQFLTEDGKVVIVFSLTENIEDDLNWGEKHHYERIDL